MSELKKEFNFILSSPIKYHSKDGQSEKMGICLNIKAPTAKDISITTVLRQSVQKAILSARKYLTKDDEKEIADKKSNISTSDDYIEEDDFESSRQIKELLLASDIDVAQIVEKFRILITKGNGSCKLEDEINFSSMHFDSMLEEDVLNLLAMYIQVFFMYSLTKK